MTERRIDIAVDEFIVAVILHDSAKALQRAMELQEATSKLAEAIHGLEKLVPSPRRPTPRPENERSRGPGDTGTLDTPPDQCIFRANNRVDLC